MRLLVINNIAAGFGTGPIYDFIRLVSDAEDEVVVRTLDPASDFATAVADAKSFDAVVVAGGDGTHSSVCYLLRNSGVPILPFPSGTANLMTLNLMLPEEPAALARIIHEGKTLDFDMGELEFRDECIGFNMMAGCGFDAAIMRSAKESKEIFGPAAYFKAALENPNPTVAQFDLTIDGKQIEAEGVGVLVINFSKIQFDISLSLANRPRDGYLDVMVMKSKSAVDLILPLVGAFFDHSGEALKQSKHLDHYQGKEISVVSTPSLIMQHDGETGDYHSPFTARVLPGASRLIVGEDTLREFAE